MRCEQELCRRWAGSEGCPCAVFGMEPDVPQCSCGNTLLNAWDDHCAECD